MFKDVGRKDIYNPKTLQGDHTRGSGEGIHALHQNGAGLAGVFPKQAVTLTKGKMNTFMIAMGLDINGRRGITQLRIK